MTFSRSFHRWKQETPQQRRIALFNKFFEGELQFQNTKEPQIVGKNFWQLFDELVDFY